MTTMIIPVQTTRTIECIVQEGKKFCETSDISGNELGMTIIITVLWMGGIAALVIKSIDWFEYTGAPLIAAFIYLILTGVLIMVFA